MSKSKRVNEVKRSSIIVIVIIGFFLGSSITNLSLGSKGEGIHINIIYSSEKASWMTIATNNFKIWWATEHPNEKISVEIHPYGSSDSVISILNGEIFPTIWSPASRIWIPFLNTKWEQTTGTDIPLVNLTESVRIIYSPVVIATWESFNQQYPIQGFNDLMVLSKNQSIPIKMAHTDPRLSNSGYMATIMALSAAAGVPSEFLTINDLLNSSNQQWLRDFESRAVYYGKSTGFLSRTMKSEGPNDLSHAILYENLIKDISNTSDAGKIIAIYPEEGMLYSDHPFCIPNAWWITEEQKIVANAFLQYLALENTVASAIEYGFRPINDDILLNPEISARFDEVFNYASNGIISNISHVPEQKAPLDGETLLKIPDLWLLTKATA